MTEAKFRQAVYEGGKFHHWHYWGFANGLYQHPVNMNESFMWAGFYDKNGEEVYQGSVVEAWSAGSKGRFVIKWRQEGSPCWVLYPAWQNGEMWHISCTEHHKGKMFIGVDTKISRTDKEGYFDDGLEVIGSSLLNPELIPIV